MESSLLKGNIEVHESSKYNPEFGMNIKSGRVGVSNPEHLKLSR